METLYPASLMASSDWFYPETKSTNWTREENKLFESALAIYGEELPDRWILVAAMTGKSVHDVINQYKELEEDVTEIEAGRIPIPGYHSSSFTLELADARDYDGYRKKPPAAPRNLDQERKKGVPWTEDEHRRFLLGLLKYGKGDWRNISRYFVATKTPTQVASHAQKYYQRQQLSGAKDKRRPSIHDINLANICKVPSSCQSDALPMTEGARNWNNPDEGESGVGFSSGHGNQFILY